MARTLVALVVATSLLLGCARAASTHPAPTATVASATAPSKATHPSRRAHTSHSTPAAAPGDGPRACPASVRTAVVARVNAERRAAALRPLASDAGLGRAAQERARAMASANRLSHSGWEGVVHRHDDASTIAENVAYNYASADAVVDAWMRSPGHRANLLGRSFRRIGVGCIVDARAHMWWAQDFAD
ncbi:MAG TPA: CAP domain-containing protein [Candidatus Binatia bacterium]|jgi:uncharacterized protein YkwD